MAEAQPAPHTAPHKPLGPFKRFSSGWLVLAVFALCGISLVAISYWKSSVEGIGFYLLAFGTGALSGAGFLAMLASWFQFLALQAEQEKSEDAFLSRFGELQAKSRKLRDELRKHSSSG